MNFIQSRTNDKIQICDLCLSVSSGTSPKRLDDLFWWNFIGGYLMLPGVSKTTLIVEKETNMFCYLSHEHVANADKVVGNTYYYKKNSSCIYYERSKTRSFVLVFYNYFLHSSPCYGFICRPRSKYLGFWVVFSGKKSQGREKHRLMSSLDLLTYFRKLNCVDELKVRPQRS